MNKDHKKAYCKVAVKSKSQGWFEVFQEYRYIPVKILGYHQIVNTTLVKFPDGKIKEVANYDIFLR